MLFMYSHDHTEAPHVTLLGVVTGFIQPDLYHFWSHVIYRSNLSRNNSEIRSTIKTKVRTKERKMDD